MWYCEPYDFSCFYVQKLAGDKRKGYVKLSRFEKFVLLVGSYEEKIFQKRSELRERKLRKSSRLCNDANDVSQFFLFK